MRERTPLPRAVIERLPQLKLIASTGSRNASIDMATADERGIQVTATGYRSTPTIEMTWALILVSARHIVRESNSVRDGGWQTSVDRELDGAGRAGPGQYRRTSRAYPRLAAAPSVHLPELSPGAAARGMTSLLRPCFSSPQVL